MITLHHDDDDDDNKINKNIQKVTWTKMNIPPGLYCGSKDRAEGGLLSNEFEGMMSCYNV